MFAEAEVIPTGETATGMRLLVIGAGYVGLVSAACLAALGHDVTVVEVDPRRLRALRAGEVPMREAGLDHLVARGIDRGRLRFEHPSTLPSARVDLVMIAVGTPPLPGGAVDLSAVEHAVRAAVLDCPDAVIVIKSTVPPGTSASMQMLARSTATRPVQVVSNPEFLREGRAVRDFMLPDRVVIGAPDMDSAALVAQLYAPLNAAIVTCRPEEAELAKYASNALLAARISFMNEVSGIADAVGADVTKVAAIVGADARIGTAFLAAGLGWGGSCFPKDVRGLANVAAGLGIATPMLTATIEANDRQQQRALDGVLALIEGIADPRVAVLGLAFKPHTDDVRESPALRLASALAAAGVEVRATDPWALVNAADRARAVRYVATALDAADGADIVVLATEWPEYVAQSWSAIADVMRGAVVFDARNALDTHAVQAAGLAYVSLGRDVAGVMEGRACVS